MSLSDSERWSLTAIAELIPELYAEGGRELADDLRADAPDLTDVQLCRVILLISGAISSLIHVVDEADAKTVVAFLHGTAVELGRIEMGAGS